MKRRVLITGGNGYLGGRLGKALAVRLDLEVISAVRSLPTGGAPRQIRLDLLDPSSFVEAVSGADTVLHLAALNDLDSARNPENAFMVNTIGTVRLVEAAAKAGVKRLIYFSTAHVYGAPLVGRISEETIPRPGHPYSITHRAAEDVVLAGIRNSGLLGLVIRLSNGFGPPNDPEADCWRLVVNDLCCQAVTKRIMTLNSSGLQQRDFIPLVDVARAVALFLDAPDGALSHRLYNLGGECSLSILDVAQRISERCEALLGRRPSLQRPDPKPGETSVALDYRIDRLKSLGFKLSGSFDTEIDDTIRFCQEVFSAT